VLVSVHWAHGGDLSQPPRIEDLRFRPENTPHRWDSTSGSKAEALKNFLERWERETGKKVPAGWDRHYPTKASAGFTGSRSQGSRRPDQHGEKIQQDARET